jgi:hypothetical protein
MLDNRSRGLISGLLYPVQFERDPVDGIERVLDVVVRTRALNASPEQYAHAVDAALGSDEQLALLIPQPHSESVIRSYLAQIRMHLP